MPVDADAGSRRPRWVTVAVLVALVLVVLLAVLWAVGGSHGPGRHLSAAHPGGSLLVEPLP